MKELAGYGTDKVKGSVISTAMNVKKLGNIYDDQPTVYDIEILTGYVWNFNNENVVWLKYERGESISQVKWDWKISRKVGKIDEEEKPGEEPKIDKLSDQGYYKNIMELIAAKVRK